MSDVFISYSRKDKTFVQKLHNALVSRDRETWVDWEGIELSVDWWKAIEEGIENADTFVFVISPDSIASEVCQREINHAVSLNKRLIPLVYRDASNVPTTLSHLNWIFLRDGDDFETGITELLRVMDTDLDWVKAHTRLTVRAVEWEDQERDDSFVLRGSDLRAAEPMLTESDKKPELTSLQTQYIVASQQSAIRRQRLILGGVGFGLLVALCLGAIALLSWLARDEAIRAQLEADSRRATAVLLAAQAEEKQATAQIQADFAATQAADARQAAEVAEVAKAQAVSDQATAIVARSTAEANRAAAEVAVQTASAAEQAASEAKDLAVTQEAQARRNEDQAITAQQTAAVAQQTAEAGQSIARASQATAEAQQAIAIAQQAAAEAAAAQAAASLKAAEAAAEKAFKAQAAAEAAASDARQKKERAQAAQRRAERALSEAQATVAAVDEEVKALAKEREAVEQLLSDVQSTLASSSNGEFCDIFTVGWRPSFTYDGTNIWLINSDDSEIRINQLNASDCSSVNTFTISGFTGLTAADIAWGGNELWVLAGGDTNQLFKLNGGSFSKVADFQAPDGSPILERLIYAEGALWGTDYYKGTIYKLNPNNGTLTGPSAGTFIDADWIQDLTYDKAGNIWLMDNTGKIHTLEISSDSVSSLTIDSKALKIQVPTAFLFDGQDIWIADEGTIDSVARIQADGKKLLNTFSTPLGGRAYDILFDGFHLWTLGEEKLYKLPVNFTFTGQRPSPMVALNDNIWAGNVDDKTLVSVLATTGQASSDSKIEFSVAPQNVIEANGNFWVNDGAGNVLKIDQAGNELATYSQAGAQFAGMAYDGQNIWLANKSATVTDDIFRLSEANASAQSFSIGAADNLASDVLFISPDIWLLTNRGYTDANGDDQNDVLLHKIDTSGNVNDTLTFSKVSASALATGDGFLYVGATQYDIFSDRSPGDKIVETLSGNTTLIKIDLSNTTLTKTINISTSNQVLANGIPRDIIYEPNQKLVWLADGQGNIYFLDPNTAPPASAFNATCRAERLAYHPGTSSVWASCPGDNSIQKLTNPSRPAILSTQIKSFVIKPGLGVQQYHLPIILK